MVAVVIYEDNVLFLHGLEGDWSYGKLRDVQHQTGNRNIRSLLSSEVIQMVQRSLEQLVRSILVLVAELPKDSNELFSQIRIRDAVPPIIIS